MMKYLWNNWRIIVVGSVICFGMKAYCESPTWKELDGSMMPIELRDLSEKINLPDSLTPFFVNHIARHGARYLASKSQVSNIKNRLLKARREGNLTDKGEEFLQVVNYMEKLTDNRWGQLDSIGKIEHENTASWIFRNWPSLKKSDVKAISSYIPRCVMSMYSFCHQLSLESSNVEVNTNEGKSFNPLMRFFKTDSLFIEYREKGQWMEIIDNYEKKILPTSPAKKMIDGLNDKEARKISARMYALTRAFAALGINFDNSEWFSYEEYLDCWKVSNLEHWILRTGNKFSMLPDYSAIPLLEEFIKTGDQAASNSNSVGMSLRFGHAETLLPLLALMETEGCSMPELQPEEVCDKWKDYEIVPLGAFFLCVYLKSSSGNVYVATYLNGKPVSPAAGLKSVCTWDELRNKWLSRINEVKFNVSENS